MEIDTTKPNAARIYDYFLGGTHNHPVDRAAADPMIQAFPDIPEGALLFRYFLHRAIRQFLQEGFTHYIDLATGLPTEGYIHDLAPEAMIIYNDLDPETVLYTREILGDRPNILCLGGDLRDVDPILDRADQFFQGERRVAICLVNVSYFIEDAALTRVFQRLYEWSAPGSRLAISGLTPPQHPDQVRIFKFYESIGTVLYGRTPDELLRLAEPWQVVGELRPVEVYAEESLQVDALSGNALKGKGGYAGILGR